VLRRTYDRLGCFEYFEGNDKCILIKEQSKTKVREVYLTSKSAGEIALSICPTHAGIMIGRLGKRLVPSLQGAEIIYQLGRKYPFITVNEMGEKLVLYGRDVFGQSITDASPNIKASQNLVIINSRQETLAIGLAKVPSQHMFKEGSVTVINVLDIGYYLRFQGKGLS